MEDLKNNGTDITWFMDVDAIQKIYKEVGDTFDASSVQKNNEDEYDEVDDEIVEEINDIDI